MNSNGTDYLVKVSISDIANTKRKKKELHEKLTDIANDFHSYESLLSNGISAHYFNNLYRAAEFVDICETKGKEPLNTHLIQANGRQLHIQDVDKLNSFPIGGFYHKRDGSVEY